MVTTLRLALVAVAMCSVLGRAHALDRQNPTNIAGSRPSAGTPFAVEMLREFSPRAKPEILATIVEQWQRAAVAGIDTPNRIHHFLAQLATETGGFRLMEENLDYSAKRLRQIFPKYFTDAEAEAAAGKPQFIANRVYGGRLGNVCPTDGWDYRGSGLIQLTGRSNFRARDLTLKLNPKLEDYPELGRTLPTAFYVALSYWSSRNINAAADRDDLVAVRNRVNGGNIGLNEARIWLAQARRTVHLPGEKSGEDKTFDKGFSDPTSRERLAVETQLVALGFLSTQNDSTKSTQDKVSAVKDSLRRFQENRDIPQTGQFDEATLYELTDPGNYLQSLIKRSRSQAVEKGMLPAFCRSRVGTKGGDL